MLTFFLFGQRHGNLFLLLSLSQFAFFAFVHLKSSTTQFLQKKCHIQNLISQKNNYRYTEYRKMLGLAYTIYNIVGKLSFRFVMVNLAKHKRLSLRLCDGVKVAAKHFHNYFSIRVFVETPSSLESFGRNTQFLVETWLRENPTER